ADDHASPVLRGEWRALRVEETQGLLGLDGTEERVGDGKLVVLVVEPAAVLVPTVLALALVEIEDGLSLSLEPNLQLFGEAWRTIEPLDFVATQPLEGNRRRRAGGHRILGRKQVPMRPLRSEEHTSDLQSRENLVCRLL